MPPAGPLTINYTYDPLNRLTAADYSTGDTYHYTYDSVGNRLTQEKAVSGQQSAISYQYDAANRLTSVNGTNYTWDNNGNLLNDGANAYTYDPANRLIAVSGQQSAFSYAYNGLGDRLAQNNTHYALDINTGLPQVLQDGTNIYTYGLDRIAQTGGSNTDYFLGDALDSTRQLVDSSDEITLAESYDPFGNPYGSIGSDSSIFNYAGEQTDVTGLQYLRARYYDPNVGRFTTRDSFPGYINSPQSQNLYVYALNNPVLYTDPSGHSVPFPANPLTRFFTESGLQLLHDIGCLPWDDWLSYIAGAEWQFGDDMTAGLLVYLTVHDLDYYQYDNAAFQQGRDFGRGASSIYSAFLVIVGTAEIEAAATSAPPTIGSGIICEGATLGGCTIVLGPALALEGGLAVHGSLVAGWGAAVVAHIKMSPHDSGGGGGGYGKLGEVVDDPDIEITQFNTHAGNHGATLEDVKYWKTLKKVVLSQNGGERYLYITREGAFVLDRSGRVITAYSSNFYDISIVQIAIEHGVLP